MRRVKLHNRDPTHKSGGPCRRAMAAKVCQGKGSMESWIHPAVYAQWFDPLEWREPDFSCVDQHDKTPPDFVEEVYKKLYPTDEEDASSDAPLTLRKCNRHPNGRLCVVEGPSEETYDMCLHKVECELQKASNEEMDPDYDACHVDFVTRDDPDKTTSAP